LWLVVWGVGKADSLAGGSAPQGDLHDTPSRGIQVPDTVWYVDEAAASLA
jgi:6-phosphogluconolactonase/glucosamine-6-phosphate isomerase/deaminase